MTDILNPPVARGFEFARVSSLRAVQLTRGSVPRVPKGHTVASTARREVAAGKIVALPRVPYEVKASKR